MSGVNPFQDASEAAYQWAAQFIQNGGAGGGGYWGSDGFVVAGDDPFIPDYAVKRLADLYGAVYVSQNFAQFAPFIPGVDVARAQEQLSNLIRLDQAAVAGADSPFEQFLGRAVGVVIVVGGAIATVGSSLVGEGAVAAESLAAADAAGGLLTEYGTTAAYAAGIAAPTATAAVAVTAESLAAADAAGGLLTEYGTTAAYEAGITATATTTAAATAESLAAADAAGGLVPEYGTTAAYSAGIAAPAVTLPAIVGQGLSALKVAAARELQKLFSPKAPPSQSAPIQSQPGAADGSGPLGLLMLAGLAVVVARSL